MIVIINFKTYQTAMGVEAVALAQLCESADREFNVDIRLAPQLASMTSVGHAVGLKLYAQHVDVLSPGRGTGFVTVEALKEAGASGSFLNHSEHRISDEDIVSACARLKERGMESIVFADTPETLARLNELVKPTFFCIEPPDLIAGAKSVSVADPDIIKRAVGLTDVPLLVGAGVRHAEDIEIAEKLGATGVVLSSGVAAAKDPEAALRGLVSGLSQ